MDGENAVCSQHRVYYSALTKMEMDGENAVCTQHRVLLSLNRQKWMERMQSAHSTEYYSALTKKEVRQCLPTRMGLVNVMPSEMSYIQKDKYFMNDCTQMRDLK